MKRLSLAAPIGAALVVASSLTFEAAQQKTGDQAARVARMTLEKSVEVRLADRRSRCMNAIGSSEFCDCLNGALPLAADFQRYITVTTAHTDADLSPDVQKVAGVILAARDRCVAAVFPTPK